MNHVNDLKMTALLIINDLPDGHILDLEHDWLIADLGLAAGTSKPLNDLWYDYLVQEGATPAHINDMMEEWLIASGYTGSVADMLADMWADGPISANFLALAPANDGTFSVDPIKGDGTATFSRTTTAYVRDHENVYREVPAGEARVQGTRRVENLLTHSNDMNHATDWTRNEVTVTTEDTVDPEGNISAGTITPSVANTGHYIYQENAIASAGIDNTQSIYAKANGYNFVQLAPSTGYAADYLNFNLSTGTIESGGLSGDIESVGNGWYRCSVTVQSTSAIGVGRIVIAPLETDAARLPSWSGDSVSGILVWRNQLENVSGQSVQTPSEYVHTTTTYAIKYYTKLVDGTPLHPTVRKEGANVLARYATRADSTAYAIGDKIILATGSGPAGGDGFYYECTTAGTSAGAAPTFDETIGNTTVDGTVTWTNRGHYKIAGYLGEQAGTNSILQSRQFDTIWINGGTPTSAQDQNGIDGVANTAWTLDDDDGAGYEYKQQSVAISNDSNTHTSSLYILKDSDTTRFPELELSLQGGTTQEISTQINTQTGAITNRIATGTVSSSVENHGLWWRLILTVTNNSTGNVTASTLFYPAVSSTFGGVTVTTGTVVVDQAQLELNITSPEGASSPIPTTTTAVTRNADVLNYQLSGNYEVLIGTAFASFAPLSTGAYNQVLGYDATRVLINSYTSASAYRFRVQQRDGTNSAITADTGLAFDSSKIQFLAGAGRWDNSIPEMSVHITGKASSSGSYDGDHGMANLSIYPGGAGIVSDVRIYDKYFTSANCEAAVDYD